MSSFAQTLACTVLGSDAVPVVVEASIDTGLPNVVIIGMRAAERVETRERVKAGLAASGFDISMRRITVSIAPADLPKSGAALDLPIAIAVLSALGAIPPERAALVSSHGELGLDGGLRAADGVVASAFAATRAGARELLVSAENAARAALAPARVLPVRSIREVVDVLCGRARVEPAQPVDLVDPSVGDEDLADVRAQDSGVEAALVAAAGGHNLLLFGAPGCGKTMLAQRLPTILPPLDPTAALEVATIHDAAGMRERELDRRPPFRAPHHTVSTQALVGGGGVRPVAGELTLAHRGVLFLDELPEFRPSAIDALRQPLEEREVRIRRAGWVARYPCSTQVVAAMNLCRCGRYGESTGVPCSCSDLARENYQGRVSGAILDRFDIRTRMRSVGSILSGSPTMSSSEAAQRVERARARQHERWGDGRLNCHLLTMSDGRLAVRAPARSRLEVLAAQHADGGRLQRATLRVARTIADLDDRTEVDVDDVLDAYAMSRASVVGAAP